MFVTVIADIVTRKEKKVIENNFAFDLQLTAEEVARVYESYKTYEYQFMSDDRELKDICDRCVALLIEMDAKKLIPIVTDLMYCLDYPQEIVAMANRAKGEKAVRHNADGTFTYGYEEDDLL